ncbi:hypothetical protein ACFL27_02560 [candidate division CSSED10-310 bacterium]|uniref:DUF5683 domain-containing protein n=1 Tax=candidate division CSSED10-310 bacterium TaxID=2855610 RepID=A0ABV6YSA4_UNCC1
MKKKLYQAFLSAFVFPGMGQFHNKRKKKGWFFVLCTLGVILFIFFSLLSSFFTVIEKDIIAGIIEPNIFKLGPIISYAQSKAAYFSSLAWQKSRIPVFLLLGLWFLSIADAFFDKSSMDSE